MRRICALLLTAAFGLGVVGCGEGAPPPPKPKPDTTKKDEKKPTEPTKVTEPAKPDTTAPAK